VQVPAALVLSDATETTHPLSVVANETSSVADPPALISVIAVPTVPVMVVFDTLSAATGASPRMTVAPASAELPPEPPHPTRSITAHAMTAPAAFSLLKLEPNAPKRLMRSLIVGRASPGLCPIIVHVFVTIRHGRREHYRVNTVIFKALCPVCGDL
jgi:hypothetical protein